MKTEDMRDLLLSMDGRRLLSTLATMSSPEVSAHAKAIFSAMSADEISEALDAFSSEQKTRIMSALVSPSMARVVLADVVWLFSSLTTDQIEAIVGTLTPEQGDRLCSIFDGLTSSTEACGGAS